MNIELRMTGGAAADGLRTAMETKLLYALGKKPGEAGPADWRHAAALALRDRALDLWLDCERRREALRPKRVYYLSMEFLIGRLLTDVASNMGLLSECRDAISALGGDFDAAQAAEPDAALGSGGLGRLAACFMESMATTGVAGMGYGIRYAHGMLRQGLSHGWQVDQADEWLEAGNPWEFERRDVRFDIGFGGHVEETRGADGRPRHRWTPAEIVRAIAYDTPIVGWGGRNVNMLRLWSARSAAPMRLEAFNRGDFIGAMAAQAGAEAISSVLYPDDSNPAGQELRLKQEYFFTAASLQDLLRRHLPEGGDPETLPDLAAIQLNDTHPALAVAELARLLTDERGLALEQAFDIARRTLCYTNHTLLPEALETWPVWLFEKLLPRHFLIVREINALHLDRVAARRGASHDLLRAASLIDEANGRRVRMGHLAFIGSRKVNGVSGLHGALMRETVFRDLHDLFPDRIAHVTNGVTFRRWLVQCNPGLASLVTDAIGEGWIADARELERLRAHASDPGLAQRYVDVKRANKQRLAALIGETTGVAVDPDAMFDVQIKRIHEYKRQLLNILETVALYQAMRDAPGKDWTPRVKIFAGKSAASYVRAKLIIKLINDVAAVVNGDPLIAGRLKVVFVPNYRVSLAEAIIPAADLSEQISTAGMEASGTGNMKFALNGALTIGTLDGANVEIRDHVGANNIFIFGLTAEQVAARRAGHDPRALIDASPALAGAVEAIGAGVFSPDDPRRFAPLVEDLRARDYFMVTADFEHYAASQRQVDDLYRTPDLWRRMAFHNTASMGWFSSDRAIAEYARDIWQAPLNP